MSMPASPRPWKLAGNTIWDADGGVVVSALNPCDRATRRLIVDAVNEREAVRDVLRDMEADAESAWEGTPLRRALVKYAARLREALDASALAPGNAAAMRAALKKIADMKFHLGDFAEPVNGDSSAIYENAKWDGKKFLGREIPAWWGAGWRESLSRAIDIARAALAAPARNCDRFKTAVEAMEEWEKYPQSRYKGCRVCPHGDASMVSPSHLTLAEWLFAPAKGGAE